MSEAPNGGTPAGSPAQSTPANTDAATNDVVAGTALAQAQEGDTLAAIEHGGSEAEPNVAADRSGGDDTLRLADLLQGEHDGNLDALLTFTSDGTNTTVHVSAGGEMPAHHEQDIVLRGVGDLTAGGARSSSAIIADLLMQGALGTDAAG